MRGRKPKEESRAEELHEKLAAWRQMPESFRPSLRKLADQLGTSEQLLSHYLKTQDEWEVNRQAARCQASGDDRGFLYWTVRAMGCEQIRRIEREINAKPPDESDAKRRLDRSLKRARAVLKARNIEWTPAAEKHHIAWWRKAEERCRRENQEARKADIRFLQQLAADGIPRAQEVLAKLNKSERRAEFNLSSPPSRAAKSFRYA